MRQNQLVLSLALIFSLLMLACDLSREYTVGGTVLLENGTPVESVEVYIDWVPYSAMKLTVFTDEAGWYNYRYDEYFEEDRVIITPSHPDYVFSPSAYDFSKGLRGNQLDLDFTASPID